MTSANSRKGEEREVSGGHPQFPRQGGFAPLDSPEPSVPAFSKATTSQAERTHGGLDPEEVRALGLDPAQVIDFSANVSPLGPAPGVRRAIAHVDLAAYPDPRCRTLAAAIAHSAGVASDAVLVGNGSSELIHLLARACLSPGSRACIFAPTFGEYAAACDGAAASVVCVSATPERQFQWDQSRVLATVRGARPALTFLCNPNNPTGVYCGPAFVGALADAAGGGGLLVLDEAYRQFVDAPWDAVPLLRQKPVVLLRSMTKDYGLAGVRLGYLLATPEVVERVRALQPSWSVSAVAQAAGMAALTQERHVADAQAIVRRGKGYLVSRLAALGLTVTPPTANFLLVEVGDGAGVRRSLLRRGIAVRDCASFGLPGYIRIAVRRLGDCRRLVAALEAALRHG